VAEANALASATGTKGRVGVTEKILKGCWQATHDAGPYGFDGDPLWDKVLQADCDFVLLQIRKATYGSDYPFSVTCTDFSCRERFEWEVDLDKLPVRHFDDAARETFSTGGNVYAVALPGTDQKVTFALPLHGDSKKAVKMRKGNRTELMTLAMRLRIKSIEGVEPHLLRKFLSDMPLPDARELIDLMDEAGCDIDTDIEVECPECDSVQEVRLPLGRAFWYPETKTSKARKEKEADSATS
jgi:hypothetical protein